MSSDEGEIGPKGATNYRDICIGLEGLMSEDEVATCSYCSRGYPLGTEGATDLASTTNTYNHES